MDPLGPIDANRMRGVDPDQWMKDMELRVADLKRKSADLAQNLAASTATVTSKDGAVTVTVAPTGAVQNIAVEQRAAGMSPDRLTASIMEALRKGQRQASGMMLEAFAPLGAGTESMNLVTSFLPPMDDEDDYPVEDDDEADEADRERYPAPQAQAQYAPPPQQYAPARQYAQPQYPPQARPAAPRRDDEDDDNQPW
ncbi:YbaB/EbfC family nucleoid-associated protein [Saccharothrix coeruleofusca]|uniref:YbaB/EbfC DNA-binding family protein n=1 Tax=Saccharothrix coeruleofusca TaxID=33919 RepID=A0A918EG54_9PSEU|nr:YbaB/EbfC family nucleoid-associated protein [Saccharothrix coeruleofusca]MBP2335097.1 DNA-binding protein YbaB [Saccharothrix coeruleofusca]GGP69106.1 hypothetical protein GCM10010185_47650 [Saccharothrix coeruleofusca]